MTAAADSNAENSTCLDIRTNPTLDIAVWVADKVLREVRKHSKPVVFEKKKKDVQFCERPKIGDGNDLFMLSLKMISDYIRAFL